MNVNSLLVIHGFICYVLLFIVYLSFSFLPLLRYMWNDDQYILWSHITQLFYQDVENGLKLLPRITYDHIKLNSYSTMRVNLAAQVLSASVAAVLRAFGTPDTQGTAKLCSMMDSFFD